MKPADVKPGQIFVNRYGMLLRVERVEKRGVVRVLGSSGSWDIHQGLTEWAELRKLWKLKSENEAREIMRNEAFASAELKRRFPLGMPPLPKS